MYTLLWFFDNYCFDGVPTLPPSQRPGLYRGSPLFGRHRGSSLSVCRCRRESRRPNLRYGAGVSGDADRCRKLPEMEDGRARGVRTGAVAVMEVRFGWAEKHSCGETGTHSVETGPHSVETCLYSGEMGPCRFEIGSARGQMWLGRGGLLGQGREVPAGPEGSEDSGVAGGAGGS
jgi:hypothetical protein